jgi:hypothetical protein
LIFVVVVGAVALVIGIDAYDNLPKLQKACHWPGFASGPSTPDL